MHPPTSSDPGGINTWPLICAPLIPAELFHVIRILPPAVRYRWLRAQNAVFLGCASVLRTFPLLKVVAVELSPSGATGGIAFTACSRHERSASKGCNLHQPSGYLGAATASSG